MTDLLDILPNFPTQKHVRLLPSLEKNLVTVADLLTLDCVEIAKRATLPLLDVKRLCADVLEHLRGDLGLGEVNPGEKDAAAGENNVDGKGEVKKLRKSGKEVVDEWEIISTLDDDMDRALGGGIPTGYITEVTGESGAGKTQFLLTLLLSAQLPAPHGLAAPTLYISTESSLPITRLSQLLRTHPLLASHPSPPSLDRVISISTPDLESQDHILRFQVPVAIKRHGIRLLILDSVAANYRAEFERPGVTKGGGNMAQRSAELVKLGQLLRNLAREHGVAIVVANQVADRFTGGSGRASPMAYGQKRERERDLQSSPLAKRSLGVNGAMPIPSSSVNAPMSSIPGSSIGNRILSRDYSVITPDPMSLDHQQRWFTGWGDDPHPSYTSSKNVKTPSLGLIWTTQIACRIALIKKPVYGRARNEIMEEGERGEPVLKRWRRWMKIVFAGWAMESGEGLNGSVEFEIRGEGMFAVKHGKGVDDDGEDIL
ncbi:putative dna repair protein rad57 protein [Botrytis fragariae]|uniref:Putative dna repair protein rad57 protein n=1 Tax=Botrytis fragariae TaxID=1964551 RepID=A0A8H6EKX7_9HELO|nr:putative dna repair protein rad57 protein [Botrytis fragariae]KAF5876048.1 putative dna repair protein rad57 protein [Botrytis fragariae]